MKNGVPFHPFGMYKEIVLLPKVGKFLFHILPIFSPLSPLYLFFLSISLALHTFSFFSFLLYHFSLKLVPIIIEFFYTERVIKLVYQIASKARLITIKA